ncbi:MAG: hypothetical protein H0X66_05485 [Verrucomicrobia bacterium]|nr:hypothetical protein [Verrucomicrobiota bacterium]
MPPNQTIVELRQLLAERFPGARFKAEPAEEKAKNVWPTGIPRIDELLHGGLLKAGITELVSKQKSSGSALFISAVLQKSAAEKQILALVDGLDSFDPATFEKHVLARLLWVRCKDAVQALKATDLLLRDRNFPLVILDLALNPAQQLRRIPSSTWYRLQRIVESSGTTFVVVTPQAMVGCAQVRMNLNGRFALDDLMEDQDQLVGKLKAELTQYRLKISDIAEKKAATAS